MSTLRLLIGLVMLSLLLTSCGLSPPSQREATAAAVHSRWLEALTSDDRELLISLAAPGEQQEIFVHQTITRMQSYIADGAGSRGGAFQAVEERGLQAAGADQYGLSLWKFETGAICYRAILTQQESTWYVREWGQLPSQECDP